MSHPASTTGINEERTALLRHQERLHRDGYVVLKGMLDVSEIQTITRKLEQLWRDEGEMAGIENYIEPCARRLANLANKGDVFRVLMRNLHVLQLVQSVVGPEIRMNMLNARSSLPRSATTAKLHRDFDPSRHPHRPELPEDRGRCACTALWMLDDFTKVNGATRLVPSSHRFENYPREDVDDDSHADEIVVEGSSGDVLVFNGHCWHGGGANTSDGERRAILIHYIRRGFRPRMDYKIAISPEVQSQLHPVERELLGIDD